LHTRFGNFYVQVNNKKEEKTAGIIFHRCNATQFAIEKKQTFHNYIPIPGWGLKAPDRSYLFYVSGLKPGAIPAEQ
jgi:hypothetical protein